MAAKARRAASDSAGSVNGSLQAQECCTVIRFEMSPRRVDTLTPWNDDYVNSCQWFTGLKQFPDPPFGAVPDHRVPDLLTGCDAQARRTDVVPQPEAGHEAPANAGAPLVDPGKLRPATQFHRDDETVNLLRPFARRLFSTMRPFFVFMRTRKPWVRRRRRRLGWKVRFIENP
jgi:hypothetical protein